MSKVDTNASQDEHHLFVALDLDERLELSIQEMRDSIESQGTTLTWPVEPPMRPHITLAAFDTSALAVIADHLMRLASKQEPIRIELCGLGLFVATGTLFAIPAISPQLLQIHSRTQGLLPEKAAHSRHLAPGHWSPHVTIATQVSDDHIGTVLRSLSRVFRNVAGNATGITLANVGQQPADSRTIEILDRFRFG